MGEIFRRTIPATALTWTGERLTTEAGQQVEVEHLHRYLLARNLCRDLDVLDVASGEGYGSAFLAQTARSVVGVELDPDAVKHAEAFYPAPNLRFLEGDARRLPLQDACVDIVVSFETIEHFYEHEAFLAEVRRVLRPGGRFVVSSPERDVYSPAALPPNPFHVRELTRAEFSSLLRSTFGHVALLGQRPILGSVLVAEDPIPRLTGGPTLTFERRSPDRFEVSDGLPRPAYLLAIASDKPVDAVPDSLYIDCHTIEKSPVEASQAHADVSQITQALAEAAQYARHLEAEVAGRDRDLLATKAALADAGNALGAMQAQGQAASAELAAARTNADKLKAGWVARDRALAETTRTINRLQIACTAAVAKTDELSAFIRHLEGRLGHMDALVQQAEHHSHVLAVQVADRSWEMDTLRSDLAQRQAALASKAAELDIVLHSSSWRLTRPLRSVLGRFPRVRTAFRRTIKLAWWTATFQLPKRIATRAKVPSPFPAAPASECSGATDLSPMPDDLTPDPLPSSAVLPDVSAPAALDQKALFTGLAQMELQEFLTSGERLSFPRSEAPDVSVVIVLWNQAHLTLRCLRALLTQLDLSIEVVLVDNASTDETGTLLSRIDGAHVVSSTTNDGFLLGCNRGAAVARGRTLLLLNNDAFPRVGALAAALAILDTVPGVGVVGGRLVLPSGRLQEAGSVIWSDASTLGYGRGLAQDAGEAMFRRDVDYCSGAFLLTPVTLWRQLGGFDEAYAPAYYEEADYCMRVRQAGHRVVYEPAAVVDHYEFGSEIKRGEAVSLMLRNRKRLRARRAAELRQHHLPFAETNMLAARERLAPEQRRLLVIDNEVPLGSLGAGYPRARELLRLGSWCRGCRRSERNQESGHAFSLRKSQQYGLALRKLQ